MTMTLKISIDPRRDLREAGQPIEEADAFFSAYSESMAAIASALGVEIDLVRAAYGSAAEHEARCTSHDLGDGETLEQTLWQSAHDVTKNVDGVWCSHAPSTATVRRLRGLVDPLCRDEDIERAVEEIDASEEDGDESYVYRAAETGLYYRADADSMAGLGAMLRRDEENAYSLWCADPQWSVERVEALTA